MKTLLIENLLIGIQTFQIKRCFRWTFFFSGDQTTGLKGLSFHDLPF